MEIMPRKAKRKQEVEKSISKTPTEENVSVKRKAIEKKAKQALGSSVSEDTVLLCSTLSDIASKDTIPKHVPKLFLPKYDQKSVVPENIPKSNESRNVPKVTGPKNASKGSKSKSSSVSKKASIGTVSEYVLKKASMDTVPISDSDETECKRVPKLTVSKTFVRKNSKSQQVVENFKIKIESSNTERKTNTVSQSNNLQASITPEPNPNVPKLMTRDNFDGVFAVPKPPPPVETLKCSTPSSASCKKKVSKPSGRKRRGFKKAAVKTSKKAALKKTASKTAVSAKTASKKINKNASNKIKKNNMPEIRVSKSCYPRRAAAVTAEVRITALQAPYSAKLSEDAKKKSKKSGTRGRAPKHRPVSIRVFKKIMTRIHRKVKPVIHQFLQLFCNPNFLRGGYNCYTHYKRMQYELERLYRILLNMLKHLSKVLHNVEGRHNLWLKKNNLYVPKKRKPSEKKINWTYPAPPSKKFRGELPVIERKPRVRRRRPQLPALEGEVLEFWTYMEQFIGEIVPLMKLNKRIRRDCRKTRHISNEENYEDLKVMQSAALEDEYLRAPYLKNDTKNIPHERNILKKQKNGEKVIKEISAREKLNKLTSLLNSLKSLYDKNSLWLQELFKWIEIEIQKQHIKKFLNYNDEIVAQICDEILEILWYERDFKENQRIKVLDYLRTRRKYLDDLNKFCKEREDLLPEKHELNRCKSSLCMECLVSKKEKKGNYRLVCL